MQLHPIMEKFYLSILDYAGLKYEDGIIKNKNEKMGEFTLDGKYITLPYFDNLKNPNNRVIFHLLNENYIKPETALFNLYKKRLIAEINIKLSHLIISLLTVASDINMQQRVRNTKLLELIANIGEADMKSIENFFSLFKASKKANEEAFILDIFIKKNGEINGTPYVAIGRINFIMPNEILKVISNSDSSDYKVFGCKLRKKDIITFNNIFQALFPNFTDPNVYIEGTDNRIFRMLNILLKTSYMITSRVNEVADLLEELNEPTLRVDEIKFNHDWTEVIEKLYEMNNEIRLIPNQADSTIEAKHLVVDESKAKVVEPEEPKPREEFNPQYVPQPQPHAPQQTQQPQQPRQLTPEEIIRQGITPVQPAPIQPVQPIYQQPVYTPSWVMQELNQQNPQQPMYPQQQPMQPMMQQPMYPQGMMQQPMYSQPMQPMMQQPMYPQGMMQQPMQQSGLALNPMFFAGNSVR